MKISHFNYDGAQRRIECNLFDETNCRIVQVILTPGNTRLWDRLKTFLDLDITENESRFFTRRLFTKGNYFSEETIHLMEVAANEKFNESDLVSVGKSIYGLNLVSEKQYIYEFEFSLVDGRKISFFTEDGPYFDFTRYGSIRFEDGTILSTSHIVSSKMVSKTEINRTI